MGMSLDVFGQNSPCTEKMSPARQSLAKVEPPTTDSYSNWLFLRALENIVCAKINEHPWMFDAPTKQITATRALIYSRQHHKPLAMARQWCWFFLYHHPKTKQLSTVKIGKIYHRDHTTVLAGMRKVKRIVNGRKASKERKCLIEINDYLTEHFGPFNIEQAAGA